MLEAYVAAIFVDSDFDFTVVEEFFHAHVRPYFEDMSLYDTFANKHPSVRQPSPMNSETRSSLTIFRLSSTINW